MDPLPMTEEIRSENMPEQAQQLEAMGTLFDTEIGVKEIAEEWLVLTYDVPNDKKGQQARYEFLKQARLMGFVQHTESVYYGPWTHEANVIAINLAQAGKVWAWHSKAASPEQAAELAMVYDRQMTQWLDEAAERLPNIRKHASDGKTGLASKMVEHTLEMVLTLEPAIGRRNSILLTEKLAKVKIAIATVMTECGL